MIQGNSPDTLFKLSPSSVMKHREIQSSNEKLLLTIIQIALARTFFTFVWDNGSIVETAVYMLLGVS